MTASPSAPRRKRRSSSTVAAFVFGLPLSLAILATITFAPGVDEKVKRYVHHPVEKVAVVMFCCAVCALGAKLRQSRAERRAFAVPLLPVWDGKTIPIAGAEQLLAGLHRQPKGVQDTLLGKRFHAVLDFLCSRGSANELDDHLRTVADNDALTQENSYSLIRFITWAIPILGFLGTVLGITGAISGVTPEVLEQSLSTVTDGLALAFDTTALALALTMIAMFFSFVVERVEQGILERVDRLVDQQLAHRFERPASQNGSVVEVVKAMSLTLLHSTEQLVQRQAELWSRTLDESDRRRLGAEKRQQQLLISAFEAALERTLQAHADRLSALEKQSLEHGGELLHQVTKLAEAIHDTGIEQRFGLEQIAMGLAAQTVALTQLQEGDLQLVRIQDLLLQNLSAVQNAGTFEQAVNSLTAAVHLLTARAVTLPTGTGNRVGPRTGAAA